MIEITEKRKIPLLERTEIVGELSYEKETPNREAVKKTLAEQLKADGKLIVVRHIYTQFGFKKAKVLANVYDKEVISNVEDVFLKRIGPKKQERAEEKKG